ncbi:hypothetical protein [Dinoroseobacter sp. S375]|uniref:hypothetical protein n=1 Tax=Dinoroseobacter sp. S375 TaxID=3415136 RepID=UPI003C7CCA08
MTVIYTNWTQGAKQPQTHARLLHSGNEASKVGVYDISGTEDGYFAEGPDGPETFEAWKPNSDTGRWGRMWSALRSVDCVCIAGHNLGSTGTTIRLDASTDGSTWAQFQPEQVIEDDSPIFWMFDLSTLRGLRILVQAGTERPTIGVVQFGRSMELEQPIFSGVTPSRYSRSTTYNTTFSQSGKILARDVERANLSGTLSFPHLTPEWIDSDGRDAILSLEQGPFFLAWRPDGTKTTSIYDDVIYGMATETPKVTTMGVLDLLQMSVSYVAEAYE